MSQPVLVDGFGEGVIHAFGAVAAPAGSHADARSAAIEGSSLASPASRTALNGADILDARITSASPVRARSTSRCSACSFMWPQMRWSTSTTGASAHWPKQATVRMVNLRSAVVSVSLSASRPRRPHGRPSSSRRLSQQAARPARVAGGAAADADRVVALRLQVEQRVECHHAVDLRQRQCRSCAAM